MGFSLHDKNIDFNKMVNFEKAAPLFTTWDTPKLATREKGGNDQITDPSVPNHKTQMSSCVLKK